jgi:hypothetical protein
MTGNGWWLTAAAVIPSVAVNQSGHLPTLSRLVRRSAFHWRDRFLTDSAQLVLGQWQMFGYQESALYTASSDLSSHHLDLHRSETAAYPAGMVSGWDYDRFHSGRD